MNFFRSVSEQLDAILSIIQNLDIHASFKEGASDLAKAVIIRDPASAIDSGWDAIGAVLQMPNAIFWEKTHRYFKGSFHNLSEQVRFAEKFNEDNEKYRDFVKRQLTIINMLESEGIIDYLASLTRCFYLFDLDQPLYFRLAKFIQDSTTEELNYLRNAKENQHFENNAMVSMLILQGLIMQESKDYKSYFVLSPLGKVLKSVR